MVFGTPASVSILYDRLSKRVSLLSDFQLLEVIMSNDEKQYYLPYPIDLVCGSLT